ncbi:MAG TPA: MBL fold metallo-hydrolase [Thermoanaerobaculia bacterium]|nr:MBL fold metallo-hydrolase [Thermoanaerobaculia bacterium]
MRVHQLDRDVYHLTGESYDSGSLVVLDGDRALLVDGLASVADAERLREIVTVEWGKRVWLLVSTHYFSDHLAAWNLFPNAPVLAHENAVATFWTEDFRSPEEAAHFRRPTIQLAGRIELAWGRHTIEIFENPGHTAGTLNVDLPAADLLHVGDTAVGRMAYLRYSAPEALDRALARAQARGRGRILRSHGPVAGADVLASARGYLEGLHARVFEARRGHGRVRSISIDDCLPPGPPATAFESFFHARNLASIEERGLYPDAA